MNEFSCKKCGSNELTYQNYVLNTVEVNISDNILHYEASKIDEKDTVHTGFGFICRKCNQPVFYLDTWLTTEEELLKYLSTDPIIIAEEERKFEEYVKEEIRQQEENEREIDETYEANDEIIPEND